MHIYIFVINLRHIYKHRGGFDSKLMSTFSGVSRKIEGKSDLRLKDGKAIPFPSRERSVREGFAITDTTAGHVCNEYRCFDLIDLVVTRWRPRKNSPKKRIGRSQAAAHYSVCPERLCARAQKEAQRHCLSIRLLLQYNYSSSHIAQTAEVNGGASKLQETLGPDTYSGLQNGSDTTKLEARRTLKTEGHYCVCVAGLPSNYVIKYYWYIIMLYLLLLLLFVYY